MPSYPRLGSRATGVSPPSVMVVAAPVWRQQETRIYVKAFSFAVAMSVAATTSTVPVCSRVTSGSDRSDQALHHILAARYHPLWLLADGLLLVAMVRRG